MFFTVCLNNYLTLASFKRLTLMAYSFVVFLCGFVVLNHLGGKQPVPNSKHLNLRCREHSLSFSIYCYIISTDWWCSVAHVYLWRYFCWNTVFVILRLLSSEKSVSLLPFLLTVSLPRMPITDCIFLLPTLEFRLSIIT